MFDADQIGGPAGFLVELMVIQNHLKPAPGQVLVHGHPGAFLAQLIRLDEDLHVHPVVLGVRERLHDLLVAQRVDCVANPVGIGTL